MSTGQQENKIKMEVIKGKHNKEVRWESKRRKEKKAMNNEREVNKERKKARKGIKKCEAKKGSF